MRKEGRGKKRKRRKALYMDQVSELSEMLVSELLKVIIKKLKTKGISGTFARITLKSKLENREVDIEKLARDKKFVKAASYRFMELKPGCGVSAVKKKFQTMLFELRPDRSERNDEVTKTLTALKASRDELLKYET
jgi:DNA-directed RNA polymerase beta' subunit